MVVWSTGTEIDASKISNPFTFKASIGIIAAIAVITAAAMLGVHLCNRSESCSDMAWNDNLWGEIEPSEWCEVNRNGSELVGQWSNTYSNFGYFFFGLIILAFGIADFIRVLFFSSSGIFYRGPQGGKPSPYILPPRNHILSWPLVSMWYGIFLLYLAFGSFIFHAHSNENTFKYDSTGIFSILSFLALYGLLLFTPVKSSGAEINRAVFLTTYLCQIALIFGLVFSQNLSHSQYIALIFFFVVLAILLFITYCAIRFIPKLYKVQIFFLGDNQQNFRFKLSVPFYFPLATALFVGGYLVQESVDVLNLPCDPDSWFQFHALWHIMTALGFFIVYLVLRSEYVEIAKASVSTKLMEEDDNEGGDDLPNEDVKHYV